MMIVILWKTSHLFIFMISIYNIIFITLIYISVNLPLIHVQLPYLSRWIHHWVPWRACRSSWCAGRCGWQCGRDPPWPPQGFLLVLSNLYMYVYIYYDYICIPYCILMYIYIILYDIYIRREREGTNGYQILRLLVVFLCSVCVSISCHAASPRTTCERHLVPPWFISYQRGWFYRFQGVRFCLLLLEEIWWKPNSALSWGKEPFWLKIWMILGSVLQVFTISVAPSCYLSQLEVCRAAQ